MKELTIYLAFGIYIVATSAIVFSKGTEWFCAFRNWKRKVLNEIPVDDELEEEAMKEDLRKNGHTWMIAASMGEEHPGYTKFKKKQQQRREAFTQRSRSRQKQRFLSPSWW
jgi:hypothetical protein